MADRETVAVAVVGAGIVGRLAALAFTGAPGLRDRVRLVDAGSPSPPRDIRTFAITAGTRRMLGALGVWHRVEDHALAARGMDIADGRIEEIVRPILLSFEGEARSGEPFVHFVEASRLHAAVEAACRDAKLDVGWNRRLVGLDALGASARLDFETDSIDARLAVGADGGRSAVRRLCGLKTVGWPYAQNAVVAIVAHEAEHEARAVQHFLPDGPLALLPLPGRRSGVVWTLPTAEAARVAGLSPAAFAERLYAAAGPERGRFETLQGPLSHPLELGLARDYVAPRVALVGDAAHRFHPLAGQGLNVGLRDVAALTEVVVEAARRGEDCGSLTVLERYQRWRRFDAVQLAAATDLLNRLFTTRLPGMRTLRDLGLGLVMRAPGLKTAIVREAAGESGALPKLLEGEPL